MGINLKFKRSVYFAIGAGGVIGILFVFLMLSRDPTPHPNPTPSAKEKSLSAQQKKFYKDPNHKAPDHPKDFLTVSTLNRKTASDSPPITPHPSKPIGRFRGAGALSDRNSPDWSQFQKMEFKLGNTAFILAKGIAAVPLSEMDSFHRDSAVGALNGLYLVEIANEKNGLTQFDNTRWPLIFVNEATSPHIVNGQLIVVFQSEELLKTNQSHLEQNLGSNFYLNYSAAQISTLYYQAKPGANLIEAYVQATNTAGVARVELDFMKRPIVKF